MRLNNNNLFFIYIYTFNIGRLLFNILLDYDYLDSLWVINNDLLDLLWVLYIFFGYL